MLRASAPGTTTATACLPSYNTHTLSLSLPHTHTHSLSLSLTHTLSLYNLTHSLTLSLSLIPLHCRAMQGDELTWACTDAGAS